MFKPEPAPAEPALPSVPTPIAPRHSSKGQRVDRDRNKDGKGCVEFDPGGDSSDSTFQMALSPAHDALPDALPAPAPPLSPASEAWAIRTEILTIVDHHLYESYATGFVHAMVDRAVELAHAPQPPPPPATPPPRVPAETAAPAPPPVLAMTPTRKRVLAHSPAIGSPHTVKRALDDAYALTLAYSELEARCARLEGDKAQLAGRVAELESANRELHAICDELLERAER